MKYHFKILALLATLSTALAAPSEINYQGVLTDQQGNPVNGVRAMQIKLYDAPTGGNMTYQENIGNVTVADGIYSFKFGASGNGIASALNGNDHLALVVDSVEQPTRTKILAVPYALKAKESEDVSDLKNLLFTLGVLANYSNSCTVTTLAGTGDSGSADGTGASASFFGPRGVVLDSSGSVYVADSGNHKIRKITSAGVVTTIAGTGTQGSADGTGAAASFNFPTGVAVDSSGNVYVAEPYNHKIRKITSAGVVTTIAGTGTQGSADGTGTAASFAYPQGVAVDSSGNVYVADEGNHKIRKITSAGVVTTIAGSGSSGSSDGQGTAASFSNPQGVAVDGVGNVYVADISSTSSKIRKITSAGVVTTLAGSGEENGSADGTGTAASFYVPSGVAVDSSGNVYVADTRNHKIRKITSTGVVTTLAGGRGYNVDGTLGGILQQTGFFGSVDGKGILASFNFPLGVAVDTSGNVYVADSGNNKIRKITITGN